MFRKNKDPDSQQEEVSTRKARFILHSLPFVICVKCNFMLDCEDYPSASQMFKVVVRVGFGLKYVILNLFVS
jgi:hypothetical protein